jgi:hypothetical protein
VALRDHAPILCYAGVLSVCLRSPLPLLAASVLGALASLRGVRRVHLAPVVVAAGG